MPHGGIGIGWWRNGPLDKRASLPRRLRGIGRNGFNDKIGLGGMFFAALGYGFRLGLSLFDVAQLPFRHQRYVIICFDHGLFQPKILSFSAPLRLIIT